MKLLLPALFLLAMTACMHLPPEVAAELSAPDGRRPNNYAPMAEAGPQAESP